MGMEICAKCHDHSNEDLCRKCTICRRDHMMKYGIQWLKDQEMQKRAEPCVHKCRFQLPNKQWIEYMCTKNLGHTGQCNFGVDTKIVERMARDVSGMR